MMISHLVSYVDLKECSMMTEALFERHYITVVTEVELII